MSRSVLAVLAAGCLTLACAGAPPPSNPPAPEPDPLLAFPAPPAPVIKAPSLVSTGATGVLASVPAQAGASYRWSIAGGSIPGATGNAAVFFNVGAAGSLTLRCTVTVAGVAAEASRTVPVVPSQPVPATFYGSGAGADYLANTQVGGANGNRVSYRFKARRTTPLEAIRVYFIWSSQRSGYGAGAGGTIQVDLQADDCTPEHRPAGPVLASLAYGNVMTQGQFYPRMVFPYPVALKGGGLYHLVFTNIDPDPASNFVSLNALYLDAQTAPVQPVLADADWAVLLATAQTPWRPRTGFTPILDLEYADGHQGLGYMEVWSGNPKAVSGTHGVRQVFKVSGPGRLYSQVRLRVRRVAGEAPLAVRVEDVNGLPLAQASVPADEAPLGVDCWVTARFPLTQVLATGVSYRLRLSAPAGTVYSLFPLRRGADKGFAPITVFPDGYAQFSSDGVIWRGWDMWGTPDLRTADLQFAFVP